MLCARHVKIGDGGLSIHGKQYKYCVCVCVRACVSELLTVTHNRGQAARQAQLLSKAFVYVFFFPFYISSYSSN